MTDHMDEAPDGLEKQAPWSHEPECCDDAGAEPGPDALQHELPGGTIACDPLGRNGKATIRVTTAGGETFIDKFDVTGADARRRFIERLIERWPGFERSDLEDALEGIAASLATRNAEAGPVMGTSDADILVALTDREGVELFHTPGGYDSQGYASIRVDEHRETWAIDSSAFQRWLKRTFYREQKQVPEAQAVRDALGVIASRAIYDGVERPVAVRLAEHENVIYLDLADQDWRAVRISKDGWEVVPSEQVPVRFIRRRGALALPAPERGGSVENLRVLVNVGTDDDWVLLVSVLVAYLRPRGPYPILIVNGEQGSAKSTLCNRCRALIDPSKAPLRRPPREERDLMIAAMNGWIVAIDNLSGVPASLSDPLCSLATGAGFATRELYSDDDEKLFDAARPIILNGIDELASRPDLLDRAVVLRLPTITETRRRDTEELDREFEALRPRILGALLDAVCAALRNRGDVRLERKPRMADFAIWASAAEPALGWAPGSFMAAYGANRADGYVQAIESAVVGPTLMAWMETLSSWEGTATELLAEIDRECQDGRVKQGKEWPKTGRAMSSAIRRIAPSLRQIGMDVEFDRRSGGGRARLILLAWRDGFGPRGGPEGVDPRDGRDAGRDGREDVDRPGKSGLETPRGPIRDGRDDRDGLLQTTESAGATSAPGSEEIDREPPTVCERPSLPSLSSRTPLLDPVRADSAGRSVTQTLDPDRPDRPGEGESGVANASGTPPRPGGQAELGFGAAPGRED